MAMDVVNVFASGLSLSLLTHHQQQHHPPPPPPHFVSASLHDNYSSSFKSFFNFSSSSSSSLNSNTTPTLTPTDINPCSSSFPTRNGLVENLHLLSLADQRKLKEAHDFLIEMGNSGITVTPDSYQSLLRTAADCRSLCYGKSFHDRLRATLLLGNPPTFLADSLLRMYCQCQSFSDALNLFDEMPVKSLTSWVIILSAYAQQGLLGNALQFFSRMLSSGLTPSPAAYFSLFQSLSDPSFLELGRQIHSHVIRAGYSDKESMQTAISNMYAKCGCFESAESLFDQMNEKNAVALTGLMVGYSQCGKQDQVLRLFATSVRQGIQLDEFVFSITLKVCAQLADLEMGQLLHAYILKLGLEDHVSVGTPLVDFYAKCASMESALQAFQRISEPNDVSWHTLISGYTQIGEFDECIRSFTSLRRNNPEVLNSFMYTSIFQSCSALADFSLGTQTHGDAIKRGLISYLHGESAMVTMYARCGRLDYAYQVFERIVEPDVVAWTAIIAGCAYHGDASKALRLFKRMQARGVRPNAITFVAIFTACSHSGLIREAEHYLEAMSSMYGIDPTIDHYDCMIDIYSRAGLLEEAYELIKTMPHEPDAMSWKSLLGGCSIHRNFELGKIAAEKLFQLDPEDTAAYILMFNLYASFGKWEEAANVRRRMSERDLRKEVGCSWISVKGKIHRFVVGDRYHPQTEEIYSKLQELNFPRISSSEEAISSEDDDLCNSLPERKEQLLEHSERLAIAYGLISAPTDAAAAIVIFKNLRACRDCHEFAKHVSGITGREIVIRDSNRFHHFKSGKCSCGDYW